MAEPKLSLRLHDAILSGDRDRVAAIKAEIAARFPARQPRGFHIEEVSDLERATTSAIAVDNILKKKLGNDWASNELETIWKLVFTEAGLALGDEMRDKIAAIKVVKNSPAPYEQWYAFNQVCTAFGGVGSDFLVMNVPTPGQVVFTMAAMASLSDRQFGEEVVKYVCCKMISEGIYVPPPTIRDMIQIPMKWMTTRESQQIWSDVYSRYNQWIKLDLDSIEPAETEIDIQAYRLVATEKAARAYLQEF